MAKKAVRKRAKRKSKIIIPPTFEDRAAQTKALATKAEDTWAPGAWHICANDNVVVVACRPGNVSQARELVRRVNDYIRSLMP